MPPKLQDRIAILFIDCWGSKPMYQFLGFRPSKIKFLGFVLLKLVLLVIAVNGGDQVKRLPGYNGDLPFTLETGYVGVGESEEVQLFYYFVESQKDPLQDPLVLWIPGGPSCTALGSLFFASVSTPKEKEQRDEKIEEEELSVSFNMEEEIDLKEI
ncbi:hypothetical protein LWI29_006854 [Acer saccharum]|uniref:Uncharacterized protein n=1 Tax=Acer saccharum TaxID=4024 RepID=A0AA39RV23_ACESA|nr:hypothetical protein LWI29_006854 [Acer saccharum]